MPAFLLACLVCLPYINTYTQTCEETAALIEKRATRATFNTAFMFKVYIRSMLLGHSETLVSRFTLGCARLRVLSMSQSREALRAHILPLFSIRLVLPPGTIESVRI